VAHCSTRTAIPRRASVWHSNGWAGQLRTGEDPTTNRFVHELVPGKRIERDQAPGRVKRQKVEVIVRRVPDGEKWGEGLRRCAGALETEWTEEDDQILVGIYEERRRNTGR
jgi:hypothetical protein